MPRGPVSGGPGGPLVRYWRARLLAEGQRVSRAEMWRRVRHIWADACADAYVAYRDAEYASIAKRCREFADSLVDK